MPNAQARQETNIIIYLPRHKEGKFRSHEQKNKISTVRVQRQGSFYWSENNTPLPLKKTEFSP
jgi:biopolymer transport protein ExbD